MRLEDRFEIFTAGLCGLRSEFVLSKWKQQNVPNIQLVSTSNIIFIVFLFWEFSKTKSTTKRPVKQFWPWRLEPPKKWHDGMKEWEPLLPLPWFSPLWHLFFNAVLVVAKKTHPEKDVVWIFARLVEPSFHCTDDALEVIRPAPRHKMSDLSSALLGLSLSLPRWLPKKSVYGILGIPCTINYDLLIEILLQRSRSIESRKIDIIIKKKNTTCQINHQERNDIQRIWPWDHLWPMELIPVKLLPSSRCRYLPRHLPHCTEVCHLWDRSCWLPGLSAPKALQGTCDSLWCVHHMLVAPKVYLQI